MSDLITLEGAIPGTDKQNMKTGTFDEEEKNS